MNDLDIPILKKSYDLYIEFYKLRLTVPKQDRYTLWHSTRVNDPWLNITGFENVRLDKSLEEGRNALTQEERQRHYKP